MQWNRGWVATAGQSLAFLTAISTSGPSLATPATDDQTLESDSAEAHKDAAAADSDADGVEVVEVHGPEVGTEDSGRSGSANPLIEEIIVTAERREANLQDVPLSISAFSGEALEARGVSDTKSLGKVTPGLQFTSQIGYQYPYIRGIGSDAFAPSVDPAVATYLDGVYLLSGQGLVMALNGIERVEVLKGPQGTLFGRNAVGGAISVFTKQPRDSWEGSLSQEFANFSSRRIKAYGGGPFTDWLTVAGDFAYGESDHQYTAVYYDVPRNRDASGRISVAIAPTEDLDIRLTYLATDIRGAGSTVQKNVHPSLLAMGAGIRAQPDDYRAVQNYRADGGGTQHLGYATVSFSSSPFDTKLTLSTQKIHSFRPSIDYDGAPEPLVSAQVDLKDKAKSAEIQLLSNDTSWGDEYFQWVLGAYYWDETGGYNPVTLGAAADLLRSLQTGAFDLTLPGGATLPINVPGNIVDLIDRIDGQQGIGSNGAEVLLYGLLDTHSISGFTQATWFIQDWLNLTAGVRYQSEKRRLYDSSSNVRIAGTDRLARLFTFDEQEKTVDNLSPKATLSLPLDDMMFYVSFGKAFKGGTFNTVNVNVPSEYVEPQEVTSYEVGAKLEFPDAACASTRQPSTTSFAICRSCTSRCSPAVPFVSRMRPVRGRAASRPMPYGHPCPNSTPGWC